MKLKNTFLVVLNLFVLSSFAQWNVATIGNIPAGNAFDVCVADGRNDGLQHVYNSSRNDGLYEFTWNEANHQWDRTTIYSGITDANLIQVEVGACRNDGINRVYSVEWNHNGGHIYESTWDGTQWNTVTVYTEADGITEIMIGDGRNDGLNRLYIGGYAAVGFNEYTWNGTSWDRVHLYDFEMEGNGFVGDATNNGQNEVYSTGEFLRQMTWNGSSFDSTSITNTFIWPDPFYMGDVRNDGINRIYANTNNGRHEISYNSSSQNWDIISLTANGKRGDMRMAKLKSDAKNAIYTTYATGWNYPNNSLIEYKWNGTSYDSTVVVDASTGATAMLNAGVGRNDDTMRLYAPNYAGNTMLELTWADPYVIPTTNIANIKLNDFNFNILQTNYSIELVFNKPTEKNYTLNLISINGKVNIAKQIIKGKSNFILNGIRKGVYIIRVNDNLQSISKKIMVL